MKSHRLIGRRAFVRIGIAAVASAALPLLGAAQAEARRHRIVRRHGAPPASSAPDKSPLSSPYTTACAMEASTGTVTFDHDMNRPWPTASLAKMMLMLIAAQTVPHSRLNLSDPLPTSRPPSALRPSDIVGARSPRPARFPAKLSRPV